MCVSRAFVCFVRVSFCYFSLPLCVGGWLRFVIVVLPGHFYTLFFFFLNKSFTLSSYKKGQIIFKLSIIFDPFNAFVVII